jgi:ring-1,2-phenylacetyl-CoA epoxidase subunit PaaA
MTTATPTETTEDQRLARRYERWDEMSDEYRDGVVRITTFQALAELVGVLPFAAWLDRAPSLARKQMLMAKVQDEVGHGHVTARVAEDLGYDRSRILRDYVEGRTKVLNVFHYDFLTWEEIGPAALLMNSAAIVQFQSLARGTYLPYARALKKIEREESFHYHHAIDLTDETMVHGDARQRALARDAVETWMPRMLAYFGPPDGQKIHENRLYRLGIKVDSNDHLREAWLTKIVPVLERLGVGPRPELVRRDESEGRWVYPTPDWKAVKHVIDGNGPASRARVDAIRGALHKNAAYRAAAEAA